MSDHSITSLIEKLEGAERRTYAIGDVHGRLDLLSQAFALIIDDAGERGADVVCLGDYVDRGPDSKGVIDLLMSSPLRDRDTLVCLMGNHEQLMLGAATGCKASESCWMGNGGVQTAISYGSSIPADHLNWLSELPLLHQDAHRIYVHAGLMPGYGPDQQDPEWCLWIRDRFLREQGGWSKHVVHGHTPQWDGKPNATEPECLAHRTNLDTGACWTGVLTVGVFDPNQAGGPISILRAQSEARV